MSTILKALRRLEEDKTSQIRRPLGEPKGAPAVPTRGRGRLVAVAAFAVGIGLGAVGLLLLPREGFELAPGIAATPAPGPEISVPGLALTLSSQDPPDRPGSRDAVSDTDGDRAAVAATLEPTPESPPRVIADAAPAVSAPPRPAPLAPSRLARVPIPAVSVARTIWHPHSERRVAEVNVEGRADPLFLREGDAVGPLVVSQIDPSGVVFLHDQIEVRRRVGAE